MQLLSDQSILTTPTGPEKKKKKKNSTTDTSTLSAPTVHMLYCCTVCSSMCMQLRLRHHRATAAGRSTCSSLPKHAAWSPCKHVFYHVCVRGSCTYHQPGTNINTSASHYASAAKHMQCNNATIAGLKQLATGHQSNLQPLSDLR